MLDALISNERIVRMNPNALIVLKERYLWKSKNAKQETPEEMFSRVARAVFPGSKSLRTKAIEAMTKGEFLPNSPTLMNAGKKNGQLAACFVLPLKDDLSQIMETLKLTALIHQSGGGTGFDFSPLRSKGSKVNSSQGAAAGPIGFLGLFNELCEVIKQGGLRRGANMGILSAEHPDILDFINCKADTSQLKNFNISVSCSDRFMRAVLAGEPSASKKFKMIAQAAWATGEPGILFRDRINKFNPTPDLGPMLATNPCGEQPLLPYEACNLGSINLSKILKPFSGKNSDFGSSGNSIDWNKLDKLVELGVLFLNGVIDACFYPAQEVHDLCHRNRKIGLGVMGFVVAESFLEMPQHLLVVSGIEERSSQLVVSFSDEGTIASSHRSGQSSFE
jgi:ribonucleoside-diphosphate reductase alpha chain